MTQDKKTEIKVVARHVFAAGSFENVVGDLRAALCYLESHMPPFGRIPKKTRRQVMGGDFRYETFSYAVESSLDQISRKIVAEPEWQRRLASEHVPLLKSIRGYAEALEKRKFLPVSDISISQKAIRLCSLLGVHEGFKIQTQHPRLAQNLKILRQLGVYAPAHGPQRPIKQPQARSAGKRRAPEA